MILYLNTSQADLLLIIHPIKANVPVLLKSLTIKIKYQNLNSFIRLDLVVSVKFGK